MQVTITDYGPKFTVSIGKAVIHNDLSPALFSIMPAKGEKGDTGEQGPQGADGRQGVDGKSAYTIAVQNGYTGTEAQWEQLMADTYTNAQQAANKAAEAAQQATAAAASAAAAAQSASEAEAIAEGDLDLTDYYKKTETYNKTEVDNKIANVSVDLSGYYTKTQTDQQITSAVSGKANQSDLTSLSQTVAGKASQSDLNTLSNTVAGKASQTDLDSLAQTVYQNTPAVTYYQDYNEDDELVNYGVAIGMNSTSDGATPYFEVSSSYYSRFHGAMEVLGGIEGVTNYRRGEVATGGTWIDGKPIYRYVAYVTGVTDYNNTARVLATLPGLPDTVISVRGMFRGATTYGSWAWYPMPNVSPSSSVYRNVAILVRSTTGEIVAWWDKDGEFNRAKNVLVIAEYTKAE